MLTDYGCDFGYWFGALVVSGVGLRCVGMRRGVVDFSLSFVCVY